MTEQVRVLVIGGGAVGCSCLYHLALLGWTDTLLLEQNELTSGSTWHAAGNCPTFSTTLGVQKLQQYSAALYRQLAADPAYPINYHVTGSVRLAHTPERMDEYRHVLGLASLNGLDYALLDPEQLRQRYPLVEIDDLLGALWDPEDGDIDPAQLTQALAAGAYRLGARVQRFARVTALAPLPGGRWRVTSSQGNYDTDVIVNAAGYRGAEIMALLGETLPMVTMSHQYLVTEGVAELSSRAERLPLLRDPDVSYYLRQERDGFILGPYERDATAMWLDGVPEDFSYQLFGDDLERLEDYIQAACRRVPALARAGVRRVVNGPIPYSPDGLPYIGPAHNLANFFHCNTFSFGIAQAGGAGKALAEWIVNGAPEWDLWPMDPRRFAGYATRNYTLAKALETYRFEYAPAFPYEERPAGRPVRTSPLQQRLADRGARFGVRGGWERALWYDTGGLAAGADYDALSFRRQHIWTQAVAAEVRAVRTSAGIMDLPGFARFKVEGPGARACLDRLLCSKLPRVGRLSLAYALTAAGGILSEFTVVCIAEDDFLLMSAAMAEWHDEDVLRAALPADGSVRLTCLTEQHGALVLAGPRARLVLRATTNNDLSNEAFPWLAARWIEVGDARLLAMRVSYAGELGWELHAEVDVLPDVYAALLRAGTPHGLRAFGLYALDSLRIDKCFRSWKQDIDIGCSPLEAGLERFVDLGKPEFVGKAALLKQRQHGIARRLVPLVLDDPGTADAPASSPVCADDELVGVTTSGIWSHWLSCSIALAYVRSDLAVPGRRLEIDVLGRRCGARVQREPLFDPDNARQRA
jgi:dimethylglycine dehydrogenase